MPESIGLETLHFAENSFSPPASRRSTKWKPPDGLTGNRQRFGAPAELLRSSMVVLGVNVPGDGHGHVKAQGGSLGEFIVYWRLPEGERGAVIVSNEWDVMYGNDLRSHLTGLY